MSDQVQVEKKTMLGFVLIPSRSAPLEGRKEMWLKSLGLADDKCVIDCDPTGQTITYNTEDGPLTRQVVECWSRVMGYHRPVTSWNIGKQAEFKDRRHFVEPSGVLPYQPRVETPYSEDLPLVSNF